MRIVLPEIRMMGYHLTRATGPLSPIASNQGSWWPVVREPFSGAWQRNKEWTTNTVLAHHAVYACITRISQDFGKLRPTLKEMDDNGIWTEVAKPSPYTKPLRHPNHFQNHIQFKEWWATSKLMHGNAYALKERDNRGVVNAFYILDPTRVKVLLAPDGSVFYELQTDNLAGLETDRLAVPAAEIVHDRINCLFHPLVGTSPIFACGMAAHMGLEIQNNSASFFGNSSIPSGLLTSTMDFAPGKIDQLSTQWNSQFTGVNAGRVAVLGGGLKFEAMRMTATDSQLIEQLKWTAETVCSTFHVPAWKVGVGEQPAYTKPEIANHAYYSDCLQAHIEQFELCMDEAFGFTTPTEGRMLGVELDLDGLLRMDTASQIATLNEAVGGTIMVPNEARRRLDLKPKPGGDQLWMQQQNYSLEALAERDRNDPFAKPEPPRIEAPPETKALPAGEQESDEDIRGWAPLLLRDKPSLERAA